jgi:hypothetical protein
MVFGQSANRFLQTYNSIINLNAESYGVVETSYGYMISGISFDTSGYQNGYYAYTLMGVDFNGNKLWEKKYGNQNLNFGNAWYSYDYLKSYKGYYYSITNAIDSTNYAFSMVFKLNENGDTLWTKKYRGDNVDSILISASLNFTADGIIHTGITGSNNNDSKLFLSKLDTLGNELWRKKYNYTTYTEKLNYSIYDSISKKYIVVGYMEGFPMKSTTYITDSLGNVLTQKYFINNGFGGILTNIRKLSDGNYLTCGIIYTGNTLGSWSLMKSILIKFDINGNVFWSKEYGQENIINSFDALEITSGDTIIVAGQIDTLFTQNLGLNTMYQIYKIDPNGNVVWNREIDIITTNGSQDVLKGLAITNDGGYALTGFFGNTPAPNPFVLVKLDKWGCLTSGCETVSVNELYENEFNFSVYPNPANSNVNLIFSQQNTLPEYYEIVNVSGKVIAKEKIYSSNTTISLSHLPPSIYLIHLIDKGRIIGSKKISIRN